jgi:streptomycin 6-kinase
MQIPNQFVAETIRRFGDAGRSWISNLPSVIDKCQSEWGLMDVQPISELSINFVCFCTSARLGDVVLKLPGPHSERFTEIEALRIFNGRSCCRMLECDMDAAAFLLKRASPGVPLRAISDRNRQLDVGVRLIASLPVRMYGASTLPSYGDWIGTAGAMLGRTHAPSELLALLRIAELRYSEINATHENIAVLHGDLHHDNVLQNGPDDWIAIDPQGVVGPSILEAGRFVQNHALPDYSQTDFHELERTTEYVANHLVESYGQVQRAMFVLHVLSMCWDWEMNIEQNRITDAIRQCTNLDRAIR